MNKERMSNFYSCIFLYVICNKHILLIPNIYKSAINNLRYCVDIFGTFLGAFAKLRKSNLVLSCLFALLPVCLSVRPSARQHRTTRLPLDGISWNLIFETFSKIYRESWGLIKTWQELRVFCTNIYVLYIYDIRASGGVVVKALRY